MMQKPKHRQKLYIFPISMGIISLLILLGIALFSYISAPVTLPSATLQSIFGRGWLTSADWRYFGDTVAFGSSTGVWLYHADDLSEPFHYLQSDAPISSVAFSADRQYLVAGSWDMRAYVWDMNNLDKPLHTLRGHRGFVNDVAIHPDNLWIATAGTDKVVRLWDFETGEEISVFEGHDHSVTKIAVTTDGQLLVSASRDETVRVWDTETGTQLRTLIITSDVLDLMSGDINRVTILMNDGFKRSFDLTTGEVVQTTQDDSRSLIPQLSTLDTVAMGFYPPVSTLEISPDAQTIAVGAGNLFTPDYRAMVWDLASETVIASLEGFDNEIITLAYQPDSTMLALGDTNGRLHLWDYQQNSLLNSMQAHDGELLSMTFTDKNTLVTGGDDAMVRVWDINSGKIITEFESPNGTVHNIVFSENINFSTDALDDSLTSYALSDEEQSLNLLCSHGDTIGVVALNHDTSLRATATFNNTILLTDVASGEILYTLEGHLNLIDNLSFSSDGRWLASASWDKTVRVWDIFTGEQLLVLGGHTRPVTSVRFSPDNQQIISGSDDGTIRVWSFDG